VSSNIINASYYALRDSFAYYLETLEDKIAAQA